MGATTAFPFGKPTNLKHSFGKLANKHYLYKRNARILAADYSGLNTYGEP